MLLQGKIIQFFTVKHRISSNLHPSVTNQILNVNFGRDYLKSGWCKEEFIMAHAETVKGRDKLIIFVMVYDIKVDDLPKVMKNFIKIRTYIDATNIKNQKDLDLFKKKLHYLMPQTPLRDVPLADDDGPEERNLNDLPMFNRINERQNQEQIEEVLEEGEIEAFL